MEEKDYDRALGAVIRRYRAVAGLSQMALAGRLGITFQQVQKYERGANRVFFGRLIKLADALGVSAEELVQETRKLAEGALDHDALQPDSFDNQSLSLLSVASRADDRVRQAVTALLRAHTKHELE